MTYTEMTILIEKKEAIFDPKYPGGAWFYDNQWYNRTGDMLKDIHEVNNPWYPMGDE